MLSALASGQLVRDPKSGTSANGTRWANTTIRVPTGQDKEGNALTSFITILAFNDDADRLAKLGKGDAISVQGPLKQTEYQAANGETRHGLEIVVNGILSPYQVQKKRGEGQRRPETKAQASDGRNVSAFHEASRSQYTPQAEDFNDAISF